LLVNIPTRRYVIRMAVQERSAATQARIVSAARTLFLGRNFADVTMEQVASSAEATKGAVYHHFSSKEELYLVMLHADLDAKQALFRRAVSMTGTCRERLARLTTDFFRLPRAERQLITLVRRDINIFSDEIRERLVRAYQAALPDQVERILLDGISDNELETADARLLSWSFVAIVETYLGPHADRVFSGPEAKVDQVINLFLDGATSRRSERLQS